MICGSGGHFLARKIVSQVVVKDSHECTSLKRSNERMSKKLKHLEKVASEVMEECPICNNKIPEDEYDNLKECKGCNDKEACVSWNHIHSSNDYLSYCRDCEDEMCMSCLTFCNTCYTFYCYNCIVFKELPSIPRDICEACLEDE